MFKDYYQILDISRKATSEEIRVAYRVMSKKWHPDRNQDKNTDEVTLIMQDINEAYTILKDTEKRSRYNNEYDVFAGQRKTQASEQTRRDETHYKTNNQNNKSQSWEYDYIVKDETLRDDISEAHNYAENLVAEFMNSFEQASKAAAKGAWENAKYYVYVAIIFTIVGLLVQMCASTSYAQSSYKPISTKASSATNHKGWTRYSIDDNSFSISVPPTVELRTDKDEYILRLKRENGIELNNDQVVFQQKGLANSKPSTEDEHYCRIIMAHYKCQPGEVFKSKETAPLDYNSKLELLEIVQAELGPNQKTLAPPQISWITIGNVKAIEIKYRRNGNAGYTTNCTLYLIYNYDEIVKLIVAYREQESNLWANDLKQVINTFKWSKEK